MLACLSKTRRSGNTGEETHRAKISWTSVEGCAPDRTCKVKGPCSQTSSVSTDTTWAGALTHPSGRSQLCGEGHTGSSRQRSLDSERFRPRVFQGRERFQTVPSNNKSRAPLWAREVPLMVRHWGPREASQGGSSGGQIIGSLYTSYPLPSLWPHGEVSRENGERRG